MPASLRATVVCFWLLVAVGCRVVEPHSAGKSPLAPVQPADDSIALEVFSAPAGHDDPQFAELWELVDEQALPADLRRRLAANGIRAGLVGPNVPAPLASVLNVTDERVEDEQRHLVSMDPEGGVKLRVLHAQAGKRIELAIPRVRDQMSLLETIDGRVGGRTYSKAECRMALRAFSEPGGRVRIELTPEVHHGEFKSRVRGTDGVLIWTQERDKRVFEELKLEPSLAAGQMLLVTCRADRPGSAGCHFFTDPTADKPLATLWVLRAARASPDRAFYEKPSDDDLPAVSNDRQP